MAKLKLISISYFLLVVMLSACAADPDFIARNATMIYAEKPMYPALSRRKSEEGQVILKIYVHPNGSIGDVEVGKSSGSSNLDLAAIVAAKKSKFTPALTRNGKAVGTWINLPYRFVLE